MFKPKTWLAIFLVMTLLAMTLNMVAAICSKVSPISSYIFGLLNGATLLGLFILYDRK